MKKTALALAILLAAVSAYAKGPQDVSMTRHNLSSTSTLAGNYYKATNEDEVCIFCHTPHGGTLNTPLWNRSLPSGSFTHYSSASLSPPMAGLSTTRPVSTESLMCMSCHDGAVAVNAITNYSNDTAALPDNAANIVPMFGLGVGSAIGATPDNQFATRDLSDDHPISFSYYDVYNNYAPNAGKLRTIAYAEGQGVRFFPANGAAAAGGKRVECSSCHDPHVNYEASMGGDATYAPFLIRSNTGSGLCLSCHIK